jgi:hypothetical protein
MVAQAGSKVGFDRGVGNGGKRNLNGVGELRLTVCEAILKRLKPWQATRRSRLYRALAHNLISVQQSPLATGVAQINMQFGSRAHDTVPSWLKGYYC